MAQPSSVDRHTLAQRLLQARKASGMTQEQAAQHLGYSRPTFIAIEKGSRSVTPEEIVKLAALYQRSVHDLVRSGPTAAPLEPHLRAAAAAVGQESAELEEAIRVLQGFADDYRQLETLVGAVGPREFPPEVALSSRVPIREFAEDIAIRERGRLHLGDQPVLDLRSLAEEAGVHVFYWEIPSPIAGMYAFVPDLGYCILINRKHPPERRRWTLAHEYAHFLCDRHRPGIDFLAESKRKPLNERFADAFAAALLMPETGIRRHFLVVTASTDDFQTADLCRLANTYFVSVQAMAYRLEDLGLLPKGAWEVLLERGFKPTLARQTLRLEAPCAESGDAVPERYRYLVVHAYVQEKITEGQLAGFLRTDRVSAREMVLAAMSAREVDSQGREQLLEIPLARSLFKIAPEA